MVGLFLLVRRRPVVCLTVAALVAGASVAAWVLAHRETLVPVSGTVSVDGKPMQSGLVSFYPNHGRGNQSPWIACGEIKDGRYEVWILYGQKGEKRGVPPGWYRVVVLGYAASDRSAAAKPFPNREVVKVITGHAPRGQKGVITAGPGEVVIDHAPQDQEGIITAGPPPGDPKDFFSNDNKPQAVEVAKAGPEGAYDLALARPRSGKHRRRQ